VPVGVVIEETSVKQMAWMRVTYIQVMGKVMLQNFGLVLLVRVGIPNLRESGDSTLRGELGARGFMVVCMWTFYGSGG